MRYWQILYHFLEIFRIFLMSSIDKRLKHVLIYTINRKKFFFFSHLPFLCSIFGACIRFMSVKSSSLKTDPKMVRIEGRGGGRNHYVLSKIRCMQLVGISGFSVLSVNYGLFHGFTTTNLHYTRWNAIEMCTQFRTWECLFLHNMASSILIGTTEEEILNVYFA